MFDAQRITLVTPPPVEPITVQDAKDFLRLDQAMTLDDAQLTSIIVAARSYCETIIRRSFIATVWDVFLDALPWGAYGGYLNRFIRAQGEGPGWLPTAGGIIWLPKAPLMSVTWFKYFDSAGVLQTLDPTTYNISLGTPARIENLYGKPWPICQPRIDAVNIRIVSGYGTDATAVPESIKAAIRLAVTHLYVNRGQANVEMPDAIGHMLAAEDAGVYL